MQTPFRRRLSAARVLMAMVFVFSGIGKVLHYTSTLEVMEGLGVRGAALLLPLATAIEIGGGLALALGYEVRWTSLLLAAYLVPVTLVFHRFWAYSGATRQAELVEVLKNLSIIGGLAMTSLYQRVLEAFTGGTLIELRRERPRRAS